MNKYKVPELSHVYILERVHHNINPAFLGAFDSLEKLEKVLQYKAPNYKNLVMAFADTKAWLYRASKYPFNHYPNLIYTLKLYNIDGLAMSSNEAGAFGQYYLSELQKLLDG